jgi:hypothetical protein
MTFALSLHRACICAINQGEQHHEENKLCGGVGVIDSDPRDRRVPVNDRRNADDGHERNAVGQSDRDEWYTVRNADDGNERNTVGNTDDRNERHTVGIADDGNERDAVRNADDRNERHTVGIADDGNKRDAVRNADDRNERHTVRHADHRNDGNADHGNANVGRRSIRDDRRLDGWRQRVARIGIRGLEFRR